MKEISHVVYQTCEALEFPVPYIFMEPGRSIVGEAGITLYRVGGIKEIPNIRTYVSVDGGMTDNPRYALYQSEYSVVMQIRQTNRRKKGNHCRKMLRSGDLIQENT